jgi:hypothetical protein
MKKLRKRAIFVMLTAFFGYSVTAQTNTADFKPSGNVIMQVFGYSKADLKQQAQILLLALGVPILGIIIISPLSFQQH